MTTKRTFHMISIIFFILTILNTVKSGGSTPKSQNNESQNQNILQSNESQVNGKKKSDVGLLKEDDNYKPNDELVSTKCDKKLLDVFGLNGEKISKSTRTKADTKSYCRRNRMTCCSAANIRSMNPSYSKGGKALRARFEVVEELFSLFRGPFLQDFINEHAEKKACHVHVQDLKIEIENEEYDFFSESFVQYHQKMIMNLLMDVENYVKKNLWYYGDVICTICNPDLQQYFKIDKNGSQVLAHTNTCSEMLEEKEFEKNLYIAYEEFLRPVFEFSVCVTEGEEEAQELEETSNAKNEEALKPIDTDGIENFIELLDKCWEDQEVGEEDCVAFCSKNFRTYSFPIPNLMTNYNIILKGLFKAWDDADIEDYYQSIKGVSFDIDASEDPISFFPMNDSWKKYQFEDIEWSFDSAKGHNLYKEIVSKKFIYFESSSILSLFALAFSAFAIF